MKSVCALAALAASTMLSSVGLAQSWFGEYNPRLGTPPEAQGWSLVTGGTQPPPVTVINGQLFQGPTTAPQYQYWLRTDMPINFGTRAGFAIELRLKIISSPIVPGGFANTWRTGYTVVATDNQGRTVHFGIADTGVRLANDAQAGNNASTPLVSVDTTSGFRTYTLLVNDTGTRLLVDGVQVATLPLTAPGTGGNELNYIFFGDGTSSTGNQSVLEGLRWGIVPSPAGTCYANCDGSTVAPFLSPADFTCFLAKYRAGCP